MAFPSVDAVLTQQFASSTSTFNIDLPSTVASGDLLLILFAHNDSGAGINLVSGPSGFTHLFEIDNSNYVQAEAWAKVADGTEGGTSVTAEFNVSRSGCAQVYRVSNWEGTLSGLEWATPTTYTLGTSRTPPALSPSWGAADTLWIAFAACGDDDEAFTGAPTSYTNLTSVVSGAGTNAGCEIGTARRENNTATETPSGSFTIANTEQWELTTFGIQPGAGGGTTVSPTGVSATASVGTVSVTLSPTVGVTGASATGQVGSVTISTGANASVTLTGLSSTGGVGSLSVTSSPLVSPSGVSATGAVGTLTVTTDSSVDVSVTGVSATGAVGFLSYVLSPSVSLTGVQATGQVGAVSIAGAGLSIAISGVQSTTAVGNVTVIEDAEITITFRQSDLDDIGLIAEDHPRGSEHRRQIANMLNKIITALTR